MSAYQASAGRLASYLTVKGGVSMPLSRRTLWIGAALAVLAAVIVVVAVYSGGGGGPGGY